MVSELGILCSYKGYKVVLILIVVEYGLGGAKNIVLTYNKTSLNPYCSGIWSRSLGLLLTDGEIELS